MPQPYEYAGQFQIDEVKIYSSSGNIIDILDIVMTVQIILSE